MKTEQADDDFSYLQFVIILAVLACVALIIIQSVTPSRSDPLIKVAKDVVKV